MHDEQILEQAAQMECLLPKLMRRLFSLEPDHPAMELPLAQLRVCIILQAGPRTLSAIGEELGISVSATTQIADRLERAGLVERMADLDDRRVKNLQLTPHGSQLMRSRREIRVRRAAKVLASVSPEMRETVMIAIQALLEATQAIVPEIPNEDPAGIRVEQ